VGPFLIHAKRIDICLDDFTPGNNRNNWQQSKNNRKKLEKAEASSRVAVACHTDDCALLVGTISRADTAFFT